jgi:hypothetical protein
MMPNEDVAARELSAERDDSFLGVNLLTEFVFCPRAGIIESEKQREDQGEDEQGPRANVNYMPPHELSDIVREIERTTRAMMRWLPVPIVSLGVTAAAGWWLGWCPAVTGVFLTMCLVKPLFTAMEQLKDLKDLYAFAQSRKPIEPDFGRDKFPDINWWELRKAGFEPTLPPRRLEDENARLVGRPWRILIRGGVRIPVFKKRIDGPNPTEIHGQHLARMAAYCYLVERSTGAESPYGIVLFGYTFKGKAINAAAAWPQFRDGLLGARRVIRELKQGNPPSQPHPGFCSGCPHGKPFVRKRSADADAERALPVIRAVGADGREYQSDCGDRFDWIPPHQKAADKGVHRA